MTNRTRTRMVLLVLAQALVVAACGDERRPGTPTAPTVVPPIIVGELIKGNVYDTAYRPLAGARVEVLDGPQANTSALTDGAGEFSLRGIFDETTRFRAAKDGHESATGTLQFCAACNPQRRMNFILGVLTPPVNIAGNYALTYTAASTCSQLPDDMRTRTYAATIEPVAIEGRPSNTLFKVITTGALFVPRLAYDNFHIGVAGDYLSLSIGDLHGRPGLVEQVLPTTYVALGGEAAGPVESNVSTISLPFDGFIDYCVTESAMVQYPYECSAPNAVVAHARCESKDHRITMTRR